jgi:hypothetical protein
MPASELASYSDYRVFAGYCQGILAHPSSNLVPISGFAGSVLVHTP